MASNIRSFYQRYLQVISRWPLDPNKEGRDLATRIRGRVGVHFPKGELSNLEGEQLIALEKEIISLERIVNNVHKKAYVSNQEVSAASGFNLESLSRATSTNFINSLNSMHDAGWWNRTKFRVYSMFQ